jgi:hypothetical protein
MRRFFAIAVAIGLLIAAKPATAAQGYVYQGLVVDPGAGSLEAMAAMRNGNLAVAYGTSAGSSVIVFDNNGNKIRTLAFPKVGISGMAIDTNGRFVFLAYNSVSGGDNYIDIFDAAGKFITSKDIGRYDDFTDFVGVTIGINNSIIYTVGIRGGNSSCGSTTDIYDTKLKLLSSFLPSNRCVFSIVAMGGKLLVASTDGNSGSPDVRVTDYNGHALRMFASDVASVFTPIAISLGQTRVFFGVQTKTGRTGLGVFDPTGKLLQLLPYPNYGVKGLTSTSAGYFYALQPYRFDGIERFGQGTPPPPPVAKAATAKVQAGHNVAIKVTTLNGPFDYLAVTKPAGKGDAYTTSTSFNTIDYLARSVPGTDTFSYTVWNSTGTSTATVSVTITPPPPVAGPPQTVTTSANDPVSVNVTAGAQNGPFTSVAVATPPAHGKAAPNKLNIVYTPDTGFTGNDSFTYTITSPGGTSAPGNVTVLVSK